MGSEIPEGATHTRDDDFYKVSYKVQFFGFGQWNDCKHANDIDGWLEELTPISTDA